MGIGEEEEESAGAMRVKKDGGGVTCLFKQY